MAERPSDQGSNDKPSESVLTDDQIMSAAANAADALDATRVSEMRAGGWHATTIFDGDSGLLRFGRLVEKAALLSARSAAVASKTAKQQFDELLAQDTTPLERLRFFCSLAMNGQDWLDVEPFFAALETPQSATEECPCTPADRVECHNTPDVNRPTNCVLRNG